MTVFPFLHRYYNGVANSPDAYEHFYTGFIATLLASIFAPHNAKAALWSLLAVWFLHFVVKEVIADGWKKHWLKRYIRKMYVEQSQMRSFAADTITRNAGFIFASPFLIFAMRGA